jgi:hypothetical protein|tara:strand:- start:4823 stop:5326 length:504 start_codon:yes stop_codon:yes gene_type:complete
MLHLRSSDGYQNIFSLDVYGELYGNTINSTTSSSPNVQYVPTSPFLVVAETTWYIKLTEQATSKEYFTELGYTPYGLGNFPRSRQFFLYLDDYVGSYHLNIATTGLYNYEVFWGAVGATNPNDSQITASVCVGMALVHNDNFENNYFQNSENGVEELTIPTTIAYNG